MNVLETMTLTYKRQEKGQVYENNLLRRIVGVKRAYKRRMGELRVAVGVKERFKKKLVRDRFKWAGHMARMGDENLTKRADAQKLEGKRRRGRQKL